MKTFRLFSMAALALMMAACSNNNDNEIASSPAQPAEAGVVHFTATLPAPGSGATTRTTMTEGTGTDDGKLLVAWKAGDVIALCHNGTKDVVTLTVDDINTDGSVTISTVITATDNDDVTVVYPAASVTSVAGATPTYANTTLTAQEGTRDYIAANLDKRVGTGNIAVSGGKASFKSNISMSTPEIAIWKLTLQDNAATPAALSATKVTIKNGSTVIAATTDITATSVVYLALNLKSGNISGADITIEATVGSDTYTYSKSGVSLAKGNYYQSTLKMTPAVPEYYNKLTKINDNFSDQVYLLKQLGRGRQAYNSSLTAAQAYALATYQAAIDGKAVYVIMSSQDDGYEIHYAVSTDASATEHTAALYDLCSESNTVRMYYVAQ